MEIARQFHPMDEQSPWAGYSPEGRRVYWMRLPGGLFGAIGVHVPSQAVIFAVRGDSQDADAFIIRMEAEGAMVQGGQFPFDPPLSTEPPPSTKGVTPTMSSKQPV
jgi:hypothetical protein